MMEFLPPPWTPAKPAIIRAASMDEVERASRYANFLPGMAGVAAMRGSASAPTFTFADIAGSASDLTTYTFAGLNLGDPASDRHFAMLCVHGQTAVRTLNAASVAGQSCGVQLTQGSTNNGFGLATTTSPVSSGGSGSTVVEWTAGVLRCGAAQYRMTGLNPVPHDTDIVLATSGETTKSLTIEVPARGFIVGVGYRINAGEPTWTGVTQDGSAAVETNFIKVASAGPFATTQNVEITCNVRSLLVASFGPP